MKNFLSTYHEALLYDKAEPDADSFSVRCRLCSHHCIISNYTYGTCGVRYNEDGKLLTTSWGNVRGLALDPIEKKPLYHFKPGSKVLSFGTPGCNFNCKNCQNCDLSQATKPRSEYYNHSRNLVLPEEIAKYAEYYQADGISYTYSEPTIFFEYARDVILSCRERNQKLFHVFVSNGFFSNDMLDIVEDEELLQAINIDLKFMDNDKYVSTSGGRLEPVLDSIRRISSMDKIHLEVINLVIPGLNDADEDFVKTSKFIAGLSPNIPLHFSRFYPHYKMADIPPTSMDKLIQAKYIAAESGLNYVYIGNMSLPQAEDTFCPNCKALLVSRSRFGIVHNVFRGKASSRSPLCPACGTVVSFVI